MAFRSASPSVTAAIRLGGPDQHGDVDVAQAALCDLAQRLLELDQRARVEEGEAAAVGEAQELGVITIPISAEHPIGEAN